MIELAVERDRYAPGERVRGRVTVRRAGLQTIEVGLVFRERAGAMELTADQVLAPEPLGGYELAEGTTLNFEIELPDHALPSVATSHGELFWEVVARTDRVGSDQVSSRRIEVQDPDARRH